MVRHVNPLFESEAPVVRRKPQQSRSEQTIERIERAMLDLVAELGYGAVSTNRIAQRARVNISSLYQYFPNRQAIALALYQRASARQAQLVHDVMMDSMALPLELSIKRLLEALVDFLDHEQMALMRLVDEVPELRQSARAMTLENLAYRTSRVYLEQHLGKLDEATMQRKLFFVQHTSMGVIRRYVQEKPAGISKKIFVTELTDLIVSYLRKL